MSDTVDTKTTPPNKVIVGRINGSTVKVERRNTQLQQAITEIELKIRETEARREALKSEVVSATGRLSGLAEALQIAKKAAEHSNG